MPEGGDVPPSQDEESLNEGTDGGEDGFHINEREQGVEDDPKLWVG